MPTENRSSNTEMVSVPREQLQAWQERFSKAQMFQQSTEVQSILSTPAPKPHPEPVAWRYQVRTDGQWYVTTTEPHARMFAGTDEGAVCEPLYPNADPGEVERLRADAVTQKAIADEAWAEVEKCRENSRIITQQVDTLRAQLAERDALLGAIAGWTQETRAAVLEAFQDELNESASYAWYDAAIADLMNLVEALSASAEPSAPAMQIPEGYCVMPRRLTAENGAKALLLGEFKLEVTRECPECLELEEPAEGCEICDGAGEYGQRYTIPWDKIKFIYSEAVKGLALKQ